MLLAHSAGTRGAAVSEDTAVLRTVGTLSCRQEDRAAGQREDWELRVPLRDGGLDIRSPSHLSAVGPESLLGTERNGILISPSLLFGTGSWASPKIVNLSALCLA